jgi:hypothetical protein
VVRGSLAPHDSIVADQLEAAPIVQRILNKLKDMLNVITIRAPRFRGKQAEESAGCRGCHYRDDHL